jgi:hypothetical protein
VVDELSPDVAEIGQLISVDGAEILAWVNRVILIVNEVADEAGAGIAGQRRSADSVGVCNW